MKVQPKSESDIALANLIPDGVYPFEVLEAKETRSTKGNDMTALKVNVVHADGEKVIFDYLVSIDSMAYKIRHFAESIGMLAEYEAGDLPAEQMVGRTGSAKVGNQPAQGGYDAKNVIKDYIKGLPSAEKTAKAHKAAAEVLQDDDIPF